MIAGAGYVGRVGRQNFMPASQVGSWTPLDLGPKVRIFYDFTRHDLMTVTEAGVATNIPAIVGPDLNVSRGLGVSVNPWGIYFPNINSGITSGLFADGKSPQNSEMHVLGALNVPDDVQENLVALRRASNDAFSMQLDRSKDELCEGGVLNSAGEVTKITGAHWESGERRRLRVVARNNRMSLYADGQLRSEGTVTVSSIPVARVLFATHGQYGFVGVLNSFLWVDDLTPNEAALLDAWMAAREFPEGQTFETLTDGA